MTSETASSFPLFTHLPTELRLRIWRLALPRRTITIQMKMNMDAWNWASHTDWWKQLYLTTTRPFTPLPRVCYACREARHELMPLYTHFAISEAARKGCLSSQRSDSDAAEPTDDEEEDDEEDDDSQGAAELPLTPRVNLATDVLDWPHFGPGVGSSRLFLAACLSARHVSLEIGNSFLIPAFQTLTMAVIDPSGPVETLSFRAQRSASLKGRLISPGQPGLPGNYVPLSSRPKVTGPELRLAPVSRKGPIVLKFENDEDVRNILKREGACMLPWYQGGWRATSYREDIQTARSRWAELEKDPGPDALADDELEYAVFMVMQPDDLSAPITGAEYKVMVRLFTEKHQVRIDGFQHLLRPERNPKEDSTLSFEPWISNNDLPEVSSSQWNPEIEWMHFHGFCSPDYGLPGW